MTLPFTHPQLDRVAERRTDSDWLQQQWESDTALAMAMCEGSVATAGPGQPLWAKPEAFDGFAERVFLGVSEIGQPYFLVRYQERHAYQLRNELPDPQWATLRDLAVAGAPPQDLNVIVVGVALANWHDTHGFCSRCGAATEPDMAGWIRRCPVDSSEHYPRVDPAVIMLLVDDQDRALLGHQSRWPRSWFSTLAGFVEPGETIAAAVIREALEEASVTVTDVQFVRDQPWPFPSSLMLGCTGRVVNPDALQADGDELSEVRWFSRDELRQAVANQEIRLPPDVSISRFLIEQWFGEALPGSWADG